MMVSRNDAIVDSPQNHIFSDNLDVLSSQTPSPWLVPWNNPAYNNNSFTGSFIKPILIQN